MPSAELTVTAIAVVMGLTSLLTDESSTHTSTVASSSEVGNPDAVNWIIAIAEKKETHEESQLHG